MPCRVAQEAFFTRQNRAAWSRKLFFTGQNRAAWRRKLFTPDKTVLHGAGSFYSPDKTALHFAGSFFHPTKQYHVAQEAFVQTKKAPPWWRSPFAAVRLTAGNDLNSCQKIKRQYSRLAPPHAGISLLSPPLLVLPSRIATALIVGFLLFRSFH
jgi:hypothetical protein